MSETTQAELIQVPDEALKRTQLLGAMSVTDTGVAICEYPNTATAMQLAAVRIAEGKEAQAVPLELDDDGSLMMELPADKPSMIGFFVGYASGLVVSAAARVGNYPGQALTTRSTAFGPKEVLVELGGIKPIELDEQIWAGQIGLFGELDFDPSKTRGIFSKSYLPLGIGSKWDDQRIAALPQSMNDLLLETVAMDVQGDTYQILGYSTSLTRPTLIPAAPFDPWTQFGTAVTRGATKSAAQPFTTGFGNVYSTTMATSSIEVQDLQGAFQLRTVPVE